MSWLRSATSLAAAGAFTLFANVALAEESAPPAATPKDPCAKPEEAPVNPFAAGSLFVRVQAGPSYLWGSGAPDTSLSSAAGGFGFAMGAFIVDGLALHGDFAWSNGFDPDFWVEGNVDHETDLVFQTSTFHVGATYYSKPMRVFASLGVGAGFAMMSSFYFLDDSVTVSSSEYTKAGPAFQLQVGKDWELSKSWGLGVAVDYQYLHVNVADEDNRIEIDNAQQIGLRFTATFAGR